MTLVAGIAAAFLLFLLSFHGVPGPMAGGLFCTGGRG